MKLRGEFMMKIALAILLCSGVSYAGEKKGLGRSEKAEIEVYGFLVSGAQNVRVETVGKTYQIDRTKFYSANKVDERSGYRAAVYKLPTKAIKSVVKNSLEESR